jgi:hypothetical protein
MVKTNTVKYLIKDMFVYGSIITLILLLIKVIFPQIQAIVYLDILLVFLFVVGALKVILE